MRNRLIRRYCLLQNRALFRAYSFVKIGVFSDKYNIYIMYNIYIIHLCIKFRICWCLN
jgi:hypothetical protein